jgi:hypothetical protein
MARQRIWLHTSARDCLADDLLGLLQQLRAELPISGTEREIGYTDGARKVIDEVIGVIDAHLPDRSTPRIPRHAAGDSPCAVHR